ncbi:MAG: hypothetical protein GY809_06090 [Planctomycetes bacterium]|nr:hypothetical protein [Planctomycetota bacterium]
MGAIFGALGFSLLIIPKIGTQGAQRLLICLAMTSACVGSVDIWLTQTQRKT